MRHVSLCILLGLPVFSASPQLRLTVLTVRGPPKLVYITHGTFSATDRDPYMPAPEGRRTQNGAQFMFNPPGCFYSCFPPYHVSDSVLSHETY